MPLKLPLLPSKNGTTSTDDLPALVSAVESLSKRLNRIEAWDDRLGSTIKRLWQQYLIIFMLLVIVGLLSWDSLRLRPDILPYLYVVDPGGEVLWRGIPGRYEVVDAIVGNHLEDWVEGVFSRPDDPTLLQLWRAWDAAVKLTQEKSECRARFNEYMNVSDPRKLQSQPRIEASVRTKKVRSKSETSGEYRLGWDEIHLSPSGQIIQQARWEGDFTVVLVPPKKLVEAEKQNRYGILLTKCSWSPQSTFGG